MAGTEASGKTPGDLTQTRTTVALVANERAGSGESAQCAERLRSFGAEVLPFGIEDAGDAAASGADRLVVAGGDGSVGVAAAAAGRAGIPLAVIPVGTANDFAGRLGLPSGISAACRLAVHGTRLQSMELGWMNGERPFVNVASAGLPAPAAERAGGWKDRLGPLAYAAGAVSAGISAQPLTCLVVCDGRELWIYYPSFKEAEHYVLGQHSFFDDSIAALTASSNASACISRSIFPAMMRETSSMSLTS